MNIAYCFSLHQQTSHFRRTVSSFVSQNATKWINREVYLSYNSILFARKNFNLATSFFMAIHDALQATPHKITLQKRGSMHYELEWHLECVISHGQFFLSGKYKSNLKGSPLYGFHTIAPCGLFAIGHDFTNISFLPEAIKLKLNYIQPRFHYSMQIFTMGKVISYMLFVS